MSNWQALALQLTELQKKSCPVPLGTDEAFKADLEAFNAKVFTQLLTIVSSEAPDSKKHKQCRFYLMMYAGDVLHTAADYFNNPSLPCNQACLLIAAMIKTPKESLVEVLLPSITKVLGSATPDNFEFSTLDPEGLFCTERFMVNSAGDALISPYDVFGNVWIKQFRIHPEPKNSTLPDGELQTIRAIPLLPLSETDLAVMGSYCGKVSQQLLAVTQQLHYLQFREKPSAASALESLCIALADAGKANQGSEFNAALLSCEQPIRAFHERWMQLTPDARATIASKKFQNHPITIGIILNCLFAGIGIALTSDEVEAMDVVLVMCVDQFSKDLTSLVNHHKDLIQIPFPIACTELPDEAAFQQMLTELDSALSQRKTSAMPGHHGVASLTKTSLVDFAYSSLSYSAFSFNALAKHFASYNDIYELIFMRLSPSLWSSVTENMPPSFFQGLQAHVQGAIFEELPLAHKTKFIAFLKTHHLLIMDTVESFIHFISQVTPDNHALLYELCHDELALLFSDENNIANILRIIGVDCWYLLRENYGDYFENFFKWDDKALWRLRKLRENDQLFFLICLLEKENNIPSSFTLEALILFLQQLPSNLAENFFRRFPKKVLEESISDHEALIQLLMSVRISIGRGFLAQCRPLIKRLIKTTEAFILIFSTPIDLEDELFEALEAQGVSLLGSTLTQYSILIDTEQRVPGQLHMALRKAIFGIMIPAFSKKNLARLLNRGHAPSLFSAGTSGEHLLLASLAKVDEETEEDDRIDIATIFQKAQIIHTFLDKVASKEIVSPHVAHALETHFGNQFFLRLCRCITLTFPAAEFEMQAPESTLEAAPANASTSVGSTMFAQPALASLVSSNESVATEADAESEYSETSVSSL